MHPDSAAVPLFQANHVACGTQLCQGLAAGSRCAEQYSGRHAKQMSMTRCRIRAFWTMPRRAQQVSEAACDEQQGQCRWRGRCNSCDGLTHSGAL